MTGDNVDSAQVIHVVENREMQRKLPDLEEFSHMWSRWRTEGCRENYQTWRSSLIHGIGGNGRCLFP